MGFPGLGRNDRVKVAKGNILARITAEQALALLKRGAKFAIENPENSWIWKHPAMVDLFATSGVITVKFHNCMFGGSRDKSTMLVTNVPALIELHRLCEGAHTHEPWGLAFNRRWEFATASECEYPDGLCNEVARLVRSAAVAVPSVFLTVNPMFRSPLAPRAFSHTAPGLLGPSDQEEAQLPWSRSTWTS